MTTALPEPDTWRELLALLINDPKERYRVSQETEIGEATLKRWANCETDPRPYALRPLIRVFPEYRDLFIKLITKEFPRFSPSDRPEFSTTEQPLMGATAKQIALSLYQDVLATRIKAPTSELLFWSVCKRVLREAIEQLDPYLEGLGIWIGRCMLNPSQYPQRSSERVVFCLRECLQAGTPPWRNDLTPMLFLGAESLAGYAISCGRFQVCQNIQENANFLPIRPEPYEESCAAFPLLYQGNCIAGCLIISSTQQDYFNEDRLHLLQMYADLVCLGFPDDAFVPRECIQLQHFPETAKQKAYFSQFRQLVSEKLGSSSSRMSVAQAEEVVWFELAQKLCGG